MTATPERLTHARIAEIRLGALGDPAATPITFAEGGQLLDLLNEKDDQLVEHGRTWRWVGPCDGCTYVEPEETCPMHGRELADWRDIADEVIGRQNEVQAERDAALAEVERLRKSVLDVPPAIATVMGDEVAKLRNELAVLRTIHTDKIIAFDAMKAECDAALAERDAALAKVAAVEEIRGRMQERWGKAPVSPRAYRRVLSDLDNALATGGEL